MVATKPSVFLLIGQESYLKDLAINDLKRSVLDSPSAELDYKVFRGGETTAKEILDYAATFPFFPGMRLVVVKDAQNLSQEDRSRLASYADKPSKFTCLVIDSKSESILKDFASVSDRIKVSRFDELSDREISRWITGFLSSRGKRIEEEALSVLKELRRRDLSGLTNELEKLISFAGERNEITAGDVENLVGASAFTSSFDLVALIDKKDITGAIRLISDLMSSGKKAYEIIGLLCWHFKNLMRAKAMELKGEGRERIIAALKINRRYADEFMDKISSARIEDIRGKLKVLLEADLDIKRTRFNPSLVLEFAVIRLCLG
jgi:DNA polymerase-3 subunit delta